MFSMGGSLICFLSRGAINNRTPARKNVYPHDGSYRDDLKDS